jgi:hypothetical protein
VAKIITIGDCSKAETRTFFEERVLPRVPERFRSALEFERLYEAFGGRLVHIQDYVTDYGEKFRIVSMRLAHSVLVNSHGRLESEWLRLCTTRTLTKYYA